MAELTYIEHLNIPKKERGHILHAYEYNETVAKINEIVDNLHTSYELSKDFPRFDKIDNILMNLHILILKLLQDLLMYLIRLI